MEQSPSIAFTDAAGNAGTPVTTTDATSVDIDNTHPTLTPVTISTTGDGDASNSDVITLAFTASEALLQDPTCTIYDGNGAAMDNSVSVDNSNAPAYECTVTVGDNDADGDLTFSIGYTDEAETPEMRFPPLPILALWILTTLIHKLMVLSHPLQQEPEMLLMLTWCLLLSL